jgi:methionyl-tRNA formyltransferase
LKQENAVKIAIIGQQDFGKAVLEAFVARGDEVAGVFVAPDKEGARPDPLKVAAQEKGLKVLQFPSYRKPEAQEALRALGVRSSTTRRCCRGTAARARSTGR